MAFFARPDLSNEQFKQLINSELTLSGVTRIATVSGLTLTNNIVGAGHRDVILTAEGATGSTATGYVLTYDGSNKIKLMQSAASGGSLYGGGSPTSISLGGISSGTVLSGRTISSILEELLIPTLNPALGAPFNTLTVTPLTRLYEIGCSNVMFSAYSTFDRGYIYPAYCSGPSLRSGSPITYNYVGIITTGITTIALTASTSFLHTITSGANLICGSVSYSGGLQPKDSAGSSYDSPLPAGTTSVIQCTITGIHPWFWGTGTTTPIVNQALISGATCKCVGASTGDIIVSNYGVTGKYIWFAIPSTSTSKTKWQGANSLSNCGTIPGDLFAAETTCSINSPSSCWSGVSYKFYLSNYPTNISYSMTFKNS